ncbi:MAG: ADP-ribosylation factor-like protein [Promethearchaeota archaeon]
MAIGIALFSWDKKFGAVLDAKYPDNFDLSNELINKIYMTHAYEQNSEDKELIEISYNGKIILSYCDKERVKDVGYEILLLILEEDEHEDIQRLKMELTKLASELFKKDKKERREFIFENVDRFFKKKTARKLLILGRAGTGKTTIKKIIFEGEDPRNLILNPLEPTRGIVPSVHSWLDLKLGVFDSSGQELNYLLENKNEQAIAFDNADVVIYIFDFPMWVAKSDEIIEEIKKIETILTENYKDAKLIIFCHKIDLINENQRDIMFTKIRERINESFNVPIYFTSIFINLIYYTYNAFYEILSSFSYETTEIKKVLDEEIKNLKKITCFITNKYDSIVIQTMTPDFNPILINHSHKLVAQINRIFESMVENDDLSHMILSSKKNLNIIIRKLDIKKFELKNIVCVSEELSVNNLIKLMGNIWLKLNQLVFKNFK